MHMINRDEPRPSVPCDSTRADVDIGVIYTHERQYLPRLVTSLAASADSHRARLLLVDNDSVDLDERWADCFPRRTLLRNARRLHYSANLNRILTAATARYALLLNTDMFFDPAQQCVSKLVQFMDTHADCGVAGCRLYHADGGYAFPARRFQGPAVVLARRFGLARPLARSLAHYLYLDRDPASTFECKWLSGCLMMVRIEAARAVGMFDERFVKYFEDVDFCLRMAQAGWRVVFYGGTHAFHLEQRASKSLLARDAWQHVRSYLRFARKWGARPHIAIADPCKRPAA